jgi:pimeloyl-ACP methyl ester carboxylesterase
MLAVSFGLSGSDAAAPDDKGRPFSPVVQQAYYQSSAVDSVDLFPIPADLSPVYRPLSIVLRLASATVALLVGVFTTWGRTMLLGTMIWSSDKKAFWRQIPWKDLIVCGIKSIAAYLVATSGLQELPRYRPSRIESKVLAERYYLPTKLSRYRSLPGIALGNVHWLQMNTKNISSSEPLLFSQAHFNHGFGANSLSWFPLLPVLTEQLGISCAYAHDAPGFGFTDRSSRYIDDFSCDRSAEIGLALLNSHEAAENPVSANSTVLLVGHSMGAFTTLKMALSMERTVKLRIILVAPAFGFCRMTSAREPSKTRKRQGSLSMATDSIAVYALRRIVGAPWFFRKALQFAWANPLKDADVLRFQWPSIVKGWERGILRFARAPLPSEERLLRLVLALPNLQSINVVVGESDRIIGQSNLQKFLVAFPKIPFSTIANCGHDPFEEDPEAFTDHLKELFAQQTTGPIEAAKAT